MTPSPIRPFVRWTWAAVAVAGCALASIAGLSLAQAPAPPAKAITKPAAEQGTRWSDLKPAQQEALRPLEREWATIEARSKQKWSLLATRFPKLTPAEQARVQERMSAWTRLTPRERGEARLNFQEAKQLPIEDRQARWKAYEALSPEQKQQLAARAAPRTAAAPTDSPARPTSAAARGDKAAPLAKSNIVPNSALTAPPTSVAPTVVQARPGATTSLITKRPAPPGHQQTGMPKIAATPEFVDKATLLPQRGPQGAAVRPAAAPAGAKSRE
jgi:Protein of unknown function (DUF3106)